MSKPDGGPAFPIAEVLGDDNCRIVEQRPGMTLRDYFAGQALIGLLSGAWGVDHKRRETCSELGINYAKGAYDIADAMIAERRKE